MPSPGELERILQVLAQAGVQVVRPRPRLRFLSVDEVCQALSMSRRWVESNMQEFPGACDLGSGNRRLVRIPEGDVTALIERRAILRS